MHLWKRRFWVAASARLHGSRGLRLLPLVGLVDLLLDFALLLTGFGFHRNLLRLKS
ncbi:hypothetical protein EMEDMD4_790337 [Sinorhizobium medicae]|uniref:Transmembrane protein n=1 Tax=Sinorhizobium medicae TaxID=110321 RepID=A0A508X6C5_9HYPH|nr:hypothetical protein EMEDMD4_1330014 [Sinorhizobium medicae]VTZ65312.1 hypothetical protein EMEDMD4_790337 [Sinorhizobium medicae]